MLKHIQCRSLACRRVHKRNSTQYIPRTNRRFPSYDPLLTINGQAIQYIGDDDPPLFKYVGVKIQYDLAIDIVSNHLDIKIKTYIKKIEATLLTGPMKAWILNNTVISKISWEVMLQNIPLGDRKRWTRLFHNCFLRWVGLAKSVEPSVLYRSYENFGLNCNHLDEVIDRLQVITPHLIKYSQDTQMNKMYKYILNSAKKNRKLSDKLQKFEEKKKHTHKLPAAIML